MMLVMSLLAECFLVKRGTDKGVFLLRQVEGEWKYLGELEGIPN